MTNTFYRTALRSSTALVAAAAIAAPAFAQQPADGSETVAESGSANKPIVITGSRIARPDIESASPVTVVSGDQIDATGAVRVEDLVNNLPQVVGGQNAFQSNGASGTATINLRNLGTVRTLVLVNGRRLQPGSTVAPVADINQIPGSLVQRIDVLTGGASATYGADAVAGVVNFVMDTEFEGVQIDGQVGFYQHNNDSDQIISPEGETIIDIINQRNYSYPQGNVVDGRSYSVNVALGAGTDDGRGHVTAYFGYRNVNPIFQGDRDYSSCAIDTNAGRTNTNCGGSSNAINVTISDPYFTYFGALVGDGSDDFSGTFTPYNFNPVNYFQRPDERFTGGAFAEYEVSSSFTAYGEFMFMDDRSVAQIAESGTFFADQYNIPCDSPLFTDAQGTFLCNLIDGNEDAGDFIDTDGDDIADTDPTGAGVVPLYLGKRNVEGGPRFDDRRHTAFRTVVGARGDITDAWRYDVYAQYGTTIFSQTYNNDFSRSRLKNALDAVFVDANGNIVPRGDPTAVDVVCRSVVNNTDPNCAVYNPFQGAGLTGGTDPTQGITAAGVGYVNIPLQSRGETEEVVVSGYVSGDLFSIGNASPWGVVLGAEYRDEKIRTYNDLSFQTGDAAGQGGPQLNVDGGYSVTEFFGELRAPIIEDAGAISYAGIEAGVRYSEYSIESVGSTFTWKVLAELELFDALKLRGGYNRAVRAPNVLELFTPNQIGLWAGSDPCAGPSPDFTAAQCANTGVPASAYGSVVDSPASQYNQLFGGFGGLKEEEADTYTVGMVLSGQSFLPGFVFTADYFNIKVNDAIQTIGAQNILNQCGLTGDPFFCDNVIRNAGSYNLWVGSDTVDGYIINTNRNIGGVRTSGIDVSAAYDMPVGNGSLFANFAGTYYFDSFTDPGVGGEYDCIGLYGPTCGTPQPEWRHQARLGYDADGGWGMSVRWRYFGGVDMEASSSQPQLAGYNDPVFNIPSTSYFDVAFNFEVMEEFEMRFGINNVFDKDPFVVSGDFAGPFNNGNAEVTVYDPAGRFIFVNGTIKF